MRRGSTGAVNGAGSSAFARGTAATISFDNTRRFSGTTDGVIIERETEGDWKGRLYPASAGAAYDVNMGLFVSAFGGARTL